MVKSSNAVFFLHHFIMQFSLMQGNCCLIETFINLHRMQPKFCKLMCRFKFTFISDSVCKIVSEIL